MKVSRWARALVPVACAVSLAACGSGASSNVVPAGLSSAHSAANVPAASLFSANLAPAGSTGRIYVSDGRNSHGGILNEVDIYSSAAPYAKIGTLTNGVNGPNAMALDDQGNLYVSNVNDATISKFAPGATTPSLVYRGKLTNPLTLTIAHDGTMYVANYYGPGKGSSIFIYPPGSTTPSTHIFGHGGYEGLAVDGNGNLFAAYNGPAGIGKVLEYPKGSTTPKDTGIHVAFAGCLAFDNNGNMIVCDQLAPSVSVYAPGSTTPLVRMSTGFTNPYQVAFDKSYSRLFVADSANFNVMVYSYPAGKVLTQISRGETAYGIALEQ